jgi:hypothetical protein
VSGPKNTAIDAAVGGRRDGDETVIPAAQQAAEAEEGDGVAQVQAHCASMPGSACLFPCASEHSEPSIKIEHM